MRFSIGSDGFCLAVITCLIFLLFAPNVLAQVGMTAQASLKEGQFLLDRGAFEKAISRLEEAAQQFANTGNIREQADALQAAQIMLLKSGRYRHPFYWVALSADRELAVAGERL